VTAEVQHTIAAAHADDESSLGEDHANGACLRVRRSRKACYREQAGQDDAFGVGANLLRNAVKVHLLAFRWP